MVHPHGPNIRVFVITTEGFKKFSVIQMFCVVLKSKWQIFACPYTLRVVCISFAIQDTLKE